MWQSFRDERAGLLGGRTLTGFADIEDAAVLARIDESARGQVMQLNPRDAEMADFGKMESRGFSRPTTTAHCELFFGGRPRTLARWPNEGQWETIARFPETAGQGDGHGGYIGELKGGFFYAGDRPRRWKDTTDVWAHGYWAWDWANSYERVVELDVERRFIGTAPPHGLYGFRKGQRIYFLNVLEELDRPGEWFLDRQNGWLYFWPPAPDKATPGARREIITKFTGRCSSGGGVPPSPAKTSKASLRSTT